MSTTVSSIRVLTGCTLSDETTLRCSGEEGIGEAVLWFGLSDGDTVAAAVGWDVRPGAVPSLVRAVRLHGARAEPVQVDLVVAWPRVHGTLRLPGVPVAFDAEVGAGRTIRGVTAAGPNEAELAPLLRGTALRLRGGTER